MDVERLISFVYEKRSLWDLQEEITITETNLLEKMRIKFALSNSEALFFLQNKHRVCANNFSSEFLSAINAALRTYLQMVR